VLFTPLIVDFSQAGTLVALTVSSEGRLRLIFTRPRLWKRSLPLEVERGEWSIKGLDDGSGELHLPGREPTWLPLFKGGVLREDIATQ